MTRVGLRSKECPQCKTLFVEKEKNWGAIKSHAAAMKDSYIKDKLFIRVSISSHKCLALIIYLFDRLDRFL